MNFEKIGFIGLGLIGGSMAQTIRRIHPETTLIAFDTNHASLNLAIKEHVIEKGYHTITSDFSDCDIIFFCTPVQYIESYLHTLKDIISPACLLTDVGSVKTGVHEAILSLHLEKQFIGGHPMTGSEKSGYDSASSHLFENAYYVLTSSCEEKPAAFQDFFDFIKSLGAIPIPMNYKEHDHVVGSISHLPHIIASSLVNLIKDLDDTDGTMKTFAAGGFKDITRIASSSPVMWEQICTTNRQELPPLIDAYISSLENIKKEIEDNHSGAIHTFFEQAKNYRDTFSTRATGMVDRIYLLYCDIIDESGQIAAISTQLATHSINIKNIGIVHNREFEEGVLYVEFYEEGALHNAVELLRKFHYTVYER